VYLFYLSCIYWKYESIEVSKIEEIREISKNQWNEIWNIKISKNENYWYI